MHTLPNPRVFLRRTLFLKSPPASHVRLPAYVFHTRKRPECSQIMSLLHFFHGHGGQRLIYLDEASFHTWPRIREGFANSVPRFLWYIVIKYIIFILLPWFVCPCISRGEGVGSAGCRHQSSWLGQEEVCSSWDCGLRQLGWAFLPGAAFLKMPPAVCKIP